MIRDLRNARREVVTQDPQEERESHDGFNLSTTLSGAIKIWQRKVQIEY
jgi:hypothetical protein